MSYATTQDNVKLYYEETGSGAPLLFVHEFAADQRNWETQVRFFSRLYRCITFSARGYPPSDVPEHPGSYSQAHARDDVVAVLDHLKIDQAHIVGLSQGGFATLHVALASPQRARSITLAGTGSGAPPQQRDQFRAEAAAMADLIQANGMEVAAQRYALGATRVQLQNKDPRGWQEFAAQLAQHSTLGSALTMRGYQAKRPSLWELEEQIKRIDVPTLIITGDEDEPCIEPSVWLKRMIPRAGLCVMPRAGHAINLEEPDAFNQAVLHFLHAVENDKWGPRDARAKTGTVLGMQVSK
jgi:pimeloyl-ACP methyl ester carboxylesterase